MSHATVRITFCNHCGIHFGRCTCGPVIQPFPWPVGFVVPQPQPPRGRRRRRGRRGRRGRVF